MRSRLKSFLTVTLTLCCMGCSKGDLPTEEEAKTLVLSTFDGALGAQCQFSLSEPVGPKHITADARPCAERLAEAGIVTLADCDRGRCTIEPVAGSGARRYAKHESDDPLGGYPAGISFPCGELDFVGIKALRPADKASGAGVVVVSYERDFKDAAFVSRLAPYCMKERSSGFSKPESGRQVHWRKVKKVDGAWQLHNFDNFSQLNTFMY